MTVVLRLAPPSLLEWLHHMTFLGGELWSLEPERVRFKYIILCETVVCGMAQYFVISPFVPAPPPSSSP